VVLNLVVIPAHLWLMNCRVSQWLRRGFGLVNRFIGSSLVVTTISSYTHKITVTIAHHQPTSNSSTTNFLWLSPTENFSARTPRKIPSTIVEDAYLHLLLLSTGHVADHIENESRDSYLASPLAGCCLATSYKHSSYCCFRLSEVFIAPLPSYTRYIIYVRVYMHSSRMRIENWNLWAGIVWVYVATGYWLDDRGVGVRVPVGSRSVTSPCHPNRLWGLPNLLSNAYRGSIPWGKAAGAWSWQSPTSAEVKKTWVYISTPPYAFMA
jgi:hypothetical protein